MNAASEQDVAKAIRRLALLYRHFAETLHAELGAERAKEIIAASVAAYGAQIGNEARAATLAKGLPLTPENFSDDLPAVGWLFAAEEINGETVTRMDYCPLAHEWADMDPALAALYCGVDQAKMEAYNPDYTYAHLNKISDGDPVCRLVVRRRKDG